MPKKLPTLVIIDGNALLHRAFHALPPLQTKDGLLVNAVYGFATILLKILKELDPDAIVATFDLRGPTFRHLAYKEYKATRVKQPQELYDQLPLIKRLVQAMNIPIYEAEGFEADDIIGTIVQENKKTKNQASNLVIITGDLDALQLIDEYTKVYTLKKGISDTVIYDAAAVEERYGLKISQLIDLKALKGDPSDNLPGVKGIGEKGAVELLQKFDTLDALYEAVDRDDAGLSGRQKELLRTSRAAAFMSRELGTIRRDVPINFSRASALRQPFDREAVAALFQEWGFSSLIGKIPTNETETGTPQAPKKNAGYHLIETDVQLADFVRELGKQGRFAFDTETTELNPRRAKLVGMSFSWREGEAYFVAMTNSELLIPNELKMILENPKIEKVCHHAKYDLEIMRNHGVPLQGITFDTMLAEYLLHPGARNYDLKSLVFREFGFEMTTIEQLTGETKSEKINITKVPLADLAQYACADADYTMRLYHLLAPRLKENGVDKVLADIEIPLVPILAEMEHAGIALDTKVLVAIAKKVRVRLQALQKTIWELAGEEFNIASPKQLKVILFEKLQISTKGLAKTKTGISTAAAELEKMVEAHPIVPKIMEHRELSKMLSTYLEALPELVEADGRIHTSFNQTIAETGRLSSSDPNLQNIPIRSELGREIRAAFVADKGNRLVSADYSQIELRVAAHLSGDKKMMAAFQQGEDIHARTAAEINGVPIEQVTKEMRYAAKAINFGILYGMGATHLARVTNMNGKEAREFIETYFKIHSGIKAYIESTKQFAREHGYVETLFGRRRYLPDIDADHPMLRAAAERMATNMPVQGTATGDIIKLAMIKLHETLPQVSARAKLLLQVHDELVLEVPADEVEKVARVVKETMENVTKLKVPLVADVKVGENWGEMIPVGAD